MANSLSDQLLKAGLITQDQIEKADQDKQQQKERAKSKKKAGHQKPGTYSKKSPGKTQTPSKPPRSAKPRPPKPAREKSDLEQFYRQRNDLERQEREAEEKRKRELAERRKKTRKQIRELINTHAKNAEEASVRFNFVVGETVKYLYVTEEQQTAIAKGELSITFIDGKRCLIPEAIGHEILALDPEKIVINYLGSEESDLSADDVPDIPVATSTQTSPALPDTGTAETTVSESLPVPDGIPAPGHSADSAAA